jgi:hypothetical protein
MERGISKAATRTAGVGSLAGEYAEVHKILVSASATLANGHFTRLESCRGYVIRDHSKFGKELREGLENIVGKYGTQELLPLWEGKGVYKFYLQKAKAVQAGGSSCSSTSPVAMDMSAADSAGGGPGQS